MTPLPTALMFAAFFLIGPFGTHNVLLMVIFFGLMANALALILVSRRSSYWRSMALLFLLTILFYENLQSVASWLRIELTEVPILGVREALNFVSFFFTLNVGLAVIGATAAVIVAVSLEVRKTRFSLARLFPGVVFSTAPTEMISSVAEISRAGGIAPPSVSLIDSGHPAAFITRTRQGYVLAISVGLVESLSKDELDACIAHELSHVKNNDFAVRSFATTARVALFAHPLGHLIEPALYRAREFLADRTAVQLTGGRDSLISALTKIRESQSYITAHPQSIATACLFNSTGRDRFLNVFDKHPGLDARINALRELSQID